MIKNILITGMPGSGKSTLLHNVITKYKDKVGFITREIRENGERRGFEIETSNNAKTILAHVSFNTPFKVSKYYANIQNLESVLPFLSEFNKQDLLYLDEIGQMELFSNKFKDLVIKYLDSDNICLATLSKVYLDDFTKNLKKRKDIILIEIDKTNRESKGVFIELLIQKIRKAQQYMKEKERFKTKGDFTEMQSTHAWRTLRLIKESWNCDCDFFKKYDICSHSIALNELAK